MKRILLFCFLFLGCAITAQGQSTTVSGTVTDAGAQTWNNGNYTFQLVANPNFPNLAQYTWTGGALAQTITGTLNGSGAYSQSLPSNTAISPQGSTWQLTVCPKATSSCFAAPNTTITGATQTLNVTPPVIAINLMNPTNTLAYSDSEIVSAIVGSMYYNLTTSQERICQAVSGQTCTTWANIGAGGGGGTVTSISATSPIVATPNPITGVGNISCPTCATGTTPTPGGANTNVQYNDSSAFGGDANLTWNKTTRSFTVTGGASSVHQITAGAGGNALALQNNAAVLQALDAGSIASLKADGDVGITSVNGKVKLGSIGTVSGQATFLGKTSGSAEVGVADVAGTPNKVLLPTTTGTSGQVLSTNGANPQQLSWVTGGTGTVNAATQFSLPYYSAAGSASTLSGVAGATSPNGVPQYFISTPSAGVATTPTLALSGVPTNAQTGTSYTFVATDRANYVTFSNAAAIAVTLPQAGSAGFGSNFVAVACDIGAGTATITPTTSTISYTTGSAYTSGAASLALTTGQCAWIYSDNTNYFAIFKNANATTINGTAFAGTNGDVVTFGAANIPADSGFLATNVVRKDTTNTGAAAMTLDMSASTTVSSFRTQVLAGAAPALNGAIAYDSTNNMFHGGLNSADSKFANFTATPAANNNCVKWVVSGSNFLLGDTGSACGSGGTPVYPLTVSGTVNSGGIPYFNSTTQSSSSALLTANVYVKGGGAGVAPSSGLTTDDGTTSTYTGTGGTKSPLFTSTGSTAGFVDYPQGTTSVAVAGCNAATSICEQAPTAVTSYLVNKPGVSATGITTNNVASAVITQGISGDANHSSTVTIGSGTSISSTTLCSSANCPAGTYVVHVYVDITTACGTSGTYIVNLIYTDDQGAKTIPVNINGTGSVPATGTLTTTSTANYGENSQVLRLTSGNLNYSTTAVACGTAGPMVGKLYMAAVPVM